MKITLPTTWDREFFAFLIVTLLFFQTTTAQSSVLIETEKLKEDFWVFRETLEKEHAGLYRYKPKRELDKLFDSCLAALDHPMTQLDFGKTIMYVISFLEDGHTGTNIPKLLLNDYTEQEKLFPVNVFFIRNKAYVLCSSNDLPSRTEILSIDQAPVAEIQKKLFQYLPSDGKIETKKNQTLNNGAFPFLYNWIYGHKDSFIVRYKTKQGKINVAAISAELVKDFQCDNITGSKDTRYLQLDFPQNNTALLTVKTFDDNRLGKQSFRNFLDSAFKVINFKQIGNLIIDLRGNGGGVDEYGALLYSYIATKPFNYFLSIESAAGKVEAKGNPLLNPLQPQSNSYKGRVQFLINGLCFSTTADFCAIARSNDRGKFIGEETGGGYYGNTSGQITTRELPNSKISIKVPGFNFANDVKKAKLPDRGVIPDYIITPTINEIIEQKDIQLNFALQFVK